MEQEGDKQGQCSKMFKSAANNNCMVLIEIHRLYQEGSALQLSALYRSSVSLF